MTATGECQPIRTEIDAGNITGVVGESLSECAGVSIPEANSVVPTATCKRQPTWAETHAGDNVGVAGEQRDFLGGIGIIQPYADRTRNSEQIAIQRIRNLSYPTFAKPSGWKVSFYAE